MQTRLSQNLQIAFLILLPCWSFACGTSDESLRQAQIFVARGEFAAANGVLQGVDSDEARALATSIQETLTQRAALEEQLVSMEPLGFKEAKAQLKTLLAEASDEWTRERLEIELSMLMDRAASNRRSQHRKAPTPKTPRELREEELVSLAAQEEAHREEQAKLALIQEAIEAGAAAEPEPEPERTVAPAVVVQAEAEPINPAPIVESPQDDGPDVPEDLLLAIQSAEEELVEASAEGREAALQGLTTAYMEDDYFLRRALKTRWERTIDALIEDPTFSAMEDLFDLRGKLKKQRKRALDLISDREEYFYPYEPPGCSAEKAGTYGQVQARVDNMVEAVEETWNNPLTVTITAELWELVEELQWHRNLGLRISYYPSLPRFISPWVLWVVESGQELGIRTLVDSERERVAQAYERAVLENNRLWWAKEAGLGLTEAEAALPHEQELAVRTNRYRKMFGRPPMAWNPQLQQAARGHSEYMERVSEVTHTEEGDSSRRSPFDRMHLVGYNYGASENISDGFVSPESALWSWSHSSAHHRNLLKAEHTEQGSARAGIYWTQLYGAGLDFQSELDSWQD